MKKIAIVLLMGIGFTSAVHAQGPVRSILTETTVNADTSILPFNSIGSKVKSFQIAVRKVSGTVAGKVYLEGTVNGVEWDRLDSVVNTDQATNKKTVPIASTIYNSYRAYYITTGTQSSTLVFACLRRPEE